MDGLKSDSETELTSTMGNALSAANKDEKNDTNDATPTSSTDANTASTASRIVSDDPISSTSSDIEQTKASEMNQAVTDLLEMNISNEKITENVEDLVHDLESLLGESTDSFSIPVRTPREELKEAEDVVSQTSGDVNLEQELQPFLKSDEETHFEETAIAPNMELKQGRPEEVDIGNSSTKTELNIISSEICLENKGGGDRSSMKISLDQPQKMTNQVCSVVKEIQQAEVIQELQTIEEEKLDDPKDEADTEDENSLKEIKSIEKEVVDNVEDEVHQQHSETADEIDACSQTIIKKDSFVKEIQRTKEEEGHKEENTEKTVSLTEDETVDEQESMKKADEGTTCDEANSEKRENVEESNDRKLSDDPNTLGNVQENIEEDEPSSEIPGRSSSMEGSQAISEDIQPISNEFHSTSEDRNLKYMDEFPNKDSKALSEDSPELEDLQDTVETNKNEIIEMPGPEIVANEDIVAEAGNDEIVSSEMKQSEQQTEETVELVSTETPEQHSSETSVTVEKSEPSTSTEIEGKHGDEFQKVAETSETMKDSSKKDIGESFPVGNEDEEKETRVISDENIETTSVKCFEQNVESDIVEHLENVDDYEGENVDDHKGENVGDHIEESKSTGAGSDPEDVSLKRSDTTEKTLPHCDETEKGTVECADTEQSQVASENVIIEPIENSEERASQLNAADDIASPKESAIENEGSENPSSAQFDTESESIVMNTVESDDISQNPLADAVPIEENSSDEKSQDNVDIAQKNVDATEIKHQEELKLVGQETTLEQPEKFSNNEDLKSDSECVDQQDTSDAFQVHEANEKVKDVEKKPENTPQLKADVQELEDSQTDDIIEKTEESETESLVGQHEDIERTEESETEPSKSVGLVNQPETEEVVDDVEAQKDQIIKLILINEEKILKQGQLVKQKINDGCEGIPTKSGTIQTKAENNEEKSKEVREEVECPDKVSETSKPSLDKQVVEDGIKQTCVETDIQVLPVENAEASKESLHTREKESDSMKSVNELPKIKQLEFAPLELSEDDSEEEAVPTLALKSIEKVLPEENFENITEDSMPPIEDILADQPVYPESTTRSVDTQENLETILAVASLQQIDMSKDVQPERIPSEKERREMEALRRAVESITDNSSSAYVEDVEELDISMEPEVTSEQPKEMEPLAEEEPIIQDETESVPTAEEQYVEEPIKDEITSDQPEVMEPLAEAVPMIRAETQSVPTAEEQNVEEPIKDELTSDHLK
ncbi:hypothetical protein JTB14_035984 [Gonioctena quinquepunctata]|nr:hypothetical protein JTB14_035984 [Gonioctena quinquepunctata]